MSYKYFPIEFSSYEDYVKYLKEKGFAIEVSEDNNPYKTTMARGKLYIQDRKERGVREVKANGGIVRKVVRCKDCDGFNAYEIFFDMDKEKLDALVDKSWDWSYAD